MRIVLIVVGKKRVRLLKLSGTGKAFKINNKIEKKTKVFDLTKRLQTESATFAPFLRRLA
ncbi:hypothetical protein [Neolewinella agarilytica]|uniref:hypothetical protein n=1 Tax=Neolewinella agarilytica TaxID=478744 RepID=UPI00111438B0|nr:hypothetical protein [Neolewinella agarilytica]